MEKQIEEALTNVQNTKTAEGEDEMTDAEKDAVSKQAKFNILKKGFYDPEGASEFKAKNEASMMSGSQNGRQSNMSSKKEDKGDKDNKSHVSYDGPPYTPLVPESWMDQLRMMQ